MKKLFLFSLLIGLSAPAFALDLFGRDKAAVAKFHFDGISDSTSAIIIDLSDTSGFKHTQTGSIDIVGVRLGVDKLAASTGTISIGVIYEVDATSGSIRHILTKRFNRDTVGTHLYEVIVPPVDVWRTELNSDGTSKWMVSNSRTAESTQYQSDTSMPCTTGTLTVPAVGDIILRVDLTGAASVDAEILYYGKR